ncbi:MAG: ABC transporter substrate-binding protein [Candidatus Improbicoccus pseudotrichonymphae]|uniref:ABC transporter substrate-binding protein n=1 Tax=Candidatus Improbicoccus pseudotrichonymphae TaxID=3033792 RepID=A0AA48IGY6_9FIRM|nr:MAG: ABC transporter substrate-binding protein [Candidatus Improbicoccus pseudotrichonymphae]
MNRKIPLIILSLLTMITLSFFLINHKSESIPKTEKINKEKDYDILIYSSKFPDDNFKDLFEKYKSYSGNVVGLIKGKEDNSDLENYINSENSPDIFSITNFNELKKQKSLGNIFDFINSSHQSFKEVTEKIPDKLKLGVDEINNCGIPLTIEGFGLILNTKVLSKIFGNSAYKSVINDLKTCDFNNFLNFVKEIRRYINKENVKDLKINGNTYKLNDDFSLSCVFSMPTGTNYILMLNSALALKFNSFAETQKAKSLNSCFDVLKSFCESIDCVAQNTIFGKDTFLNDSKVNSESKNLNKFANDQSLFYIGSDSVYEKIQILNPAMSKNLIHIPYKIDANENEIVRKNFKSSITIFCPIYLAINSKSKKLNIAQDFLSWLKMSPVARELMTSKLKFVQYDSEETNLIENPLSISTLNYLKSDNYLPFISRTFPENWKNNVENKIKTYLKIKNWESSFPKDFASFCLNEFINN